MVENEVCKVTYVEFEQEIYLELYDLHAVVRRCLSKILLKFSFQHVCFNNSNNWFLPVILNNEFDINN